MFVPVWLVLPRCEATNLGVFDLLSDPRNHNHKSLAIANHSFEVASFSRRNRNEIAVLQLFSESQ